MRSSEGLLNTIQITKLNYLFYFSFGVVGFIRQLTTIEMHHAIQ